MDFNFLYLFYLPHSTYLTLVTACFIFILFLGTLGPGSHRKKHALNLDKLTAIMENAKSRDVEFLKQKLAAALGFPLGTSVSFTDSGRKFVGNVRGVLLKIKLVTPQGESIEYTSIENIEETHKAAALKRANVPFPLGLSINWLNPIGNMYGNLTQYSGEVVGYELIVSNGEWEEEKEPSELTVLNVARVANTKLYVDDEEQKENNNYAGKGANSVEAKRARNQLIRAKAQLARLGRATTDAELAAELKKVQRQNAMWGTKKGGRKSRKNRKTRRMN